MIKWITLLILILVGCGSPKWTSINSYPTQESIIYNVDSVCKADFLPLDVSDWLLLPLQDYEDRDMLLKYYYNKDSIIYIRTDSAIIKRQ